MLSTLRSLMQDITELHTSERSQGQWLNQVKRCPGLNISLLAISQKGPVIFLSVQFRKIGKFGRASTSKIIRQGPKINSKVKLCNKLLDPTNEQNGKREN